MTFFAAFLGTLTALASMEAWKHYKEIYKIERKTKK